MVKGWLDSNNLYLPSDVQESVLNDQTQKELAKWLDGMRFAKNNNGSIIYLDMESIVNNISLCPFGINKPHMMHLLQEIERERHLRIPEN